MGGNVVALFKTANGVREFKHVLTLKEGTSFHWSDPFPNGISDNHTYQVEPFGDGKTRFTNVDEFKGTAPPPTTTLGIATGAAQGYMAFNRELRTEVQRRKAQR